MTDKDQIISEDELHAYVDGELPVDRRSAVEAWLARHAEDAARVAAWRKQAELIQARYGGIVNEKVPGRLNFAQMARRHRIRWIAAAAAASIAVFVAGGLAGWTVHGFEAQPSSDLTRFTADALEAYRLYVVEVRHPVEVPGSERAHMTQWLSKRLGSELRIPNLESIGLKLVGGRLLPGPTGAAAFYMYEGPSGERYTIYCAKAATPESALRFRKSNQFAAFYWVDDKVAYAVAGPADRERLEQVAKSVYEQVDKTGARKS